MKKLLVTTAIVVAIVITAKAGVVIPSGPEHRDLHSVVIFKGGADAGAVITLNIEAVQDGDFIQYISAIITDCDDEKNDPPGKPKPPACPQVAEEVNFMFTQTIKCSVGPPKVCTIKQLWDLDLRGTVFQANILKHT